MQAVRSATFPLAQAIIEEQILPLDPASSPSEPDAARTHQRPKRMHSCIANIETVKKTRFEPSVFVSTLKSFSLEPENRNVLQALIHSIRSLVESHSPLSEEDKEPLKESLDRLDSYVTKHTETRSTSDGLDAKEIWPRGLPRENEIRCMYNGSPGREMGVDIDWLCKTLGYEPKNEERQAKERELKSLFTRSEELLGFTLQKEEVDTLVSALSEKGINALNHLKATLAQPATIELFCLIVAQQFMRLGVEIKEYKSLSERIVTNRLAYSINLPLERCIFEDGSDLLSLVHILKLMIENAKIDPKDVNVYIGRLDQIQNRFKTYDRHLGHRIYFQEATMPFYHASNWTPPIPSRYRYGVSLLVEDIQRRQLEKVSLKALEDGIDPEIVRSQTRSRLYQSGASQQYSSYVDSELQTSLKRSSQLIRTARYKSITQSSNPQFAHFYCPITLEIMKNPVKAADNQNYEEKSIREWIAQARSKGLTPLSPLHGHPLANDTLEPNDKLKEEIAKAWKKGLIK